MASGASGKHKQAHAEDSIMAKGKIDATGNPTTESATEATETKRGPGRPATGKADLKRLTALLSPENETRFNSFCLSVQMERKVRQFSVGDAVVALLDSWEANKPKV